MVIFFWRGVDIGMSSNNPKKGLSWLELGDINLK